MNKGQFIRFAIIHSERSFLECLLNNMVDEIPMIKEQLWKIFSDTDAGFVVRDKNKLYLRKNFNNNGKEKNE